MAGKLEKWLTDDGLATVAAWARRGLTDADIAHNMHISRSTLAAWKKAEPKLREAIDPGKDEADAIVENALYRNATGYDYDEEVAFTVKRVEYKDGKRVSEEAHIETATISRHKPAETGAAAFWLKNRKPTIWKDKHDVELRAADEKIVMTDAKDWGK